MPGALDGIRIIDFGHYIAGPLAATMLSDQGAEVIHIDPPGGPRWDVRADAFLNRGKQRIGLDLKKSEDLAVAQKLIEGADVVIENFRPGVMDRLGLGADAMTKANPKLVYLSLPGFAAEDPRAGVAAWEGIIDAATGNCRARGAEAPPQVDVSRPVFSSVPLASNFAGFLGAASVVAALTARHKTGKGQRVEVPLYNAMFTAIGPAGSHVTAKGVNKHGSGDVNGSGQYQCGDGRWIQFDPAQHRFLTFFATAAGIDHWGPEYLDIYELQDKAKNKRLHERLRELFKTKTAEEWETIGRQGGAVLGFIRTCQEWMATEHAQKTGAAIQLEDPKFGPTWMPGLPVRTNGSPSKVRGPRHLPDADHDAVLKSLDRKPSTAGEGSATLSHPFEGFKVLDLCQVLAGPTSGRLLAEFGADVIKVYGPQRRVGGHGYLNRGKRTLLLDLNTVEGQHLFWKLVETADVVIQNFPRGTAERYGIGYEQVKARKADIIYASLSCYGYGGVWDSGRGYERQGQAVTGIMEHVDEVPAILGPYNLVDIGTGIMNCFAISLALFHKTRTGEGQHVWASLAQTSTYHQATYSFDYEGFVADEPRGWLALGTGALQRFYQAQDGWLFLGAAPAQAGDVARIAGLGSADDITEAALEEAIATKPIAEWVTCFAEADVSAHAMIELSDLMKDPVARSQGLTVTEDVPGVGEVTMPGISVKMSKTPLKLGKTATVSKAEAEAVLGEVGMAEAIPELEKAWALQVSNLPSPW